MRIRSVVAAATVCALAMALAACGSDDSGDGGDVAADGTGRTMKVGTFAPLTGPASATFKITPAAVKARLEAYKDSGGKCAGVKFDVIEGDDLSTAEGALKVAQKLVQSDKVDVIVHDSSFFYAASQFLATQGKDVPVFGGGFDAAPEYRETDNNIFGVFAPLDWDTTYDQPGVFIKSKGVTKIAGIAYDNESSANGLKQQLRSTDAAGIAQGYVNMQIPFGSTDVAPIIQGIIDSKADGLIATLNPETSFGVVAGLAQAGVKLKFVLLPTGYGADLLKSEPAVQAAQGVTFSTSATPTELETDATKAQSEALKKYAGNESGIPSFAETLSWAGADMFLYALEKAGCDATGPEMIKALRNDSGWDAGGLLGTPRDFGSAKVSETCSFYVTLQDHSFVPEPEGSPACGKPID